MTNYTYEEKQNALDEAWEIMNPKLTNLERLNNIKVEITKARQLWKNEAYQEGDEILFDLEENHLNWLIERTERAQELEKLLEGNDGMSVKEIRDQFTDLHRDFLKVQNENKRLRDALVDVKKNSPDGSFPHLISTLVLEGKK
jgi:hypothetical protein